MICRLRATRLRATRAAAALRHHRCALATNAPLQVDKTEGLARLHKPGSLYYVLRPPGWGKTTMLQSLADLLQGGAAAKHCFSEDTWIRQHRNLLFRQPAMLPLVLSLSSVALVREPLGAQLQRQLVDVIDGDAGGNTQDTASGPYDSKKDRMVRMIASLSESYHHHSSIEDMRDVTAMLMTDCLETASKQLHGNKRIAVLVDDFDAPFLAHADAGNADLNTYEPKGLHPSFAAGLLRGCADSVKHMRGGAAMFMTGTFRASHPSLDANLLQSHMVDLSLDMLHNNTWGLLPRDLRTTTSSPSSSTPWVDTVALAARLGAKNIATRQQQEAKRFRWDESSMQPVRDGTDNLGADAITSIAGQAVASAAAAAEAGSCETASKPAALAMDVPLSHSGGYWFGGYDTETGQPEALFPCRPWGPSMDITMGVHMLDPACSQQGEQLALGFSQLATGLFNMNPMERWHASVGVGAQADGASPTNDWSVVLLQAGVLTLAARAVRFDEFHSYAWARLGFPNETARLAFAERVVRPAVETAARRLQERGLDEEKNAWHTLRSAQLALSEVLLLRPAEGTPSARKEEEEEDNALVASLVGSIKAFSRILALGVSADTSNTEGADTGNRQRCEANFFKILMLCVPHLDVHDRRGDDVSDTGLGQDTFAGSSGSAIMDDLAPQRKGVELVARRRCGVSALPAYAAELNWGVPPVDTLHVLDVGLGVRAAVKFV